MSERRYHLLMVKNHFREKISFSDLNHILLPGRFTPGFVELEFYNQAFEFWLSFWRNVIKLNGSKDEINPYCFLRSELVSLITTPNREIVGLHLYSFLNLEKANIQWHPYFLASYDRAFLTELHNRKIRSVMPFEYLSVNEAWRKSKVGFSFSPVVMGLGYKIQKHLKIDASLGRCRQDLKVNDRMIEVGGSAIIRDVSIHNTPTDYCSVLLGDLHDHPDKSVQQVINDLWSRRKDYSGLTKSIDTGRAGRFKIGA